MIWMWIGFVVFGLLMLALDLGVFHRKVHVVTVKEAVAWSAVWLALGSAFLAAVDACVCSHSVPLVSLSASA